MIKLAPVITIDGPSGVGKSALSKKIANKLNWSLLESGLIYRIIALLALQKNVSIIENNIIPIARKFDFSLIKKAQSKITKCEKNIFYYLHSHNISNLASQLSTYPYIRRILLKKQQSFRCLPGLIAEGRDMGTVVFPDAILKFFLNASLECRTKRRFLELKKNGYNVDYKQLLKEIQDRDQRDENRLISPLYPSKNAIILNSTNMSFLEVVNISMIYILKKIKI
ncbi:(d)CMP kinase [Buchnera aphidicola]|uniref:(d)CMP kinase n=1 Tax=Buchnera aphidicola TaxID=9 RepID=UPI003464D156